AASPAWGRSVDSYTALPALHRHWHTDSRARRRQWADFAASSWYRLRLNRALEYTLLSSRPRQCSLARTPARVRLGFGRPRGWTSHAVGLRGAPHPLLPIPALPEQ